VTALGVIAFIVALLVSVMLHELGHYVFARRYGMKVTEFFVGFGPRLWSFTRGETEYGVKAIPAGGYVRIIGMTTTEPLRDEEHARAFYGKSVPQRIIVLAAGSIVHFIVGILLITIIVGGIGTPRQTTTIASVSPCIPVAAEPCRSDAPASPAAEAGLAAGDRILSINGESIQTWDQATTLIRASAERSLTMVVERDGERRSINLTPVARERPALDDPNRIDPRAGIIGIASEQENFRENPGAALVRGVTDTGGIIAASVRGLISLPSKVPSLFSQATGNTPRDSEGLVGIYGVARFSGETLANGDVSWGARIAFFLYVIAALNIFVGIFNALPLLPLDGGHIAVAIVDGVKRTRARRRGDPVPPPFDITRLAPLTYAVFLTLVALTFLLLAADIINPIQTGW
jgi:membrane-associated protease RseP (regulator of RpoE activity)